MSERGRTSMLYRAWNKLPESYETFNENRETVLGELERDLEEVERDIGNLIRTGRNISHYLEKTHPEQLEGAAITHELIHYLAYPRETITKMLDETGSEDFRKGKNYEEIRKAFLEGPYIDSEIEKDVSIKASNEQVRKNNYQALEKVRKGMDKLNPEEKTELDRLLVRAKTQLDKLLGGENE